jgi:hypothetical protein
MGGNIGVQSRVGIGTTFVVTFPQIESSDRRPTSAAHEDPASVKKGNSSHA